MAHGDVSASAYGKGNSREIRSGAGAPALLQLIGLVLRIGERILQRGAVGGHPRLRQELLEILAEQAEERFRRLRVAVLQCRQPLGVQQGVAVEGPAFSKSCQS